MLVGIDASRAIRAIRTGTEFYSLHLIQALLDRDSPRRYRLYFDHPPGKTFPPSARAEEYVIPMSRAWTHMRLSAELLRRRPDLLFVPSHVIPLICPVPSVVSIHDVGYLWYRSAYSLQAWVRLHLGTLQNTRAASRIVVDSHATARDLTQHFGVARERIRVAYLGGPPVEEVRGYDEIRTRYGLPEHYFLFLGTLQPRKNLERVLRAFALVCERMSSTLGLALAGQAGHAAPRLHRLVESLGVTDRVHWLGYVADADRPALFAGSLGFVFPSLYEGFGLPALEAMAWGAPVVASNVASLPEVVGDAGVLVDPYDIGEIAVAMRQLLDDRRLRESLIARGRERARSFTWERCAAEVEATFAEIG